MDHAPYVQQLQQGLQALGYIEPRNIVLELRLAEARPEALSGLAAGLVDSKVDVIVALSTPAAVAAKQATPSLPIVMCAPSDPVNSALIANLARPGGNVTGLTDAGPDVTAKRIPTPERVGAEPY
jgi:putative ABC transport system substrate-binding protein